MIIIHGDLNSSVTGNVYNEHILPLLKNTDFKIIAFNILPSEEVKFPKELSVYCANNNIIRAVKNLLEVSKEKNVIFNFHAVHISVVIFLGLLFPSIRKLIKIHTVHTSFGNYKLRNKILAFLSYFLADKVIFCSYSSYSSQPKLIKNYLYHKYVVIQNGVNLEKINNINIKKRKNKIEIIVLGRLINIKNPILILKVFKKLKNNKNMILRYIGEGNLKSVILKKIKDLGLEKNVILDGLLSREEVYEKLKKADLLISSSTIEGFPVSVLEGIACKCSIILSSIPSHIEIKQTIKNIQIFSSEEELIKKIEEYEVKTEEEIQKEVEENYINLKKNFSLDIVLKKYNQEYINLLEKNIKN